MSSRPTAAPFFGFLIRWPGRGALFFVLSALFFSTQVAALARPAAVDRAARFHKRGQVWVLDRNAVRQVWYKNGTLKAKGPFRNGLREGKWIFYHANGKRKAEGSFLHGKQDGEWRLYAKSGRKVSEGRYVAGRREGLWSFYFADGRLRLKGPYKRGLREGLWSNYYRSGRIFYTGSYKRGLADGEWSYYFAGGELNQKGSFRRGVRYGAWRVCVQPKGPCGTETYSHSRSPRLSRLKRSFPKSAARNTKNPAALLEGLDGGGVPDKTPRKLKESSW